MAQRVMSRTLVHFFHAVMCVVLILETLKSSVAYVLKGKNMLAF